MTESSSRVWAQVRPLIWVDEIATQVGGRNHVDYQFVCTLHREPWHGELRTLIAHALADLNSHAERRHG